MAAKVIDGHRVAAQMQLQLAARVAALGERGIGVGLAAVLAGDDATARSYAKSQARHAGDAGIAYRLVEVSGRPGATEIGAAIDALNADASVHGIMVHLPLPEGVDAFSVQQRIAVEKDVEGVGAANFGLLAMGRSALVPCTAAAALACLQSVVPDVTGQHAVIIGRSTIVGRPLAMRLLAEHATVTQCHTRTRDLGHHTRQAQILIAAAGTPGLIGEEHVSEGAVVIDVGTNRVKGDDGKMRTVGDVRFDEVAPVASAITPVPGGVGPVTVMMLLANVVSACERQRGP